MEQQSFLGIAQTAEKASRLEIGHDSTFDKFWERYPKKRAKAQAKKAWSKVRLTRGLFAEIIEALEAQKLTPDWQKNEGQYIPLPATWINGQRWEDEIFVGVQAKQIQRSNKCHRCGRYEGARLIEGKVWCIECYQKYA